MSEHLTPEQRAHRDAARTEQHARPDVSMVHGRTVHTEGERDALATQRAARLDPQSKSEPTTNGSDR